jgi:2'-hydroxyisoflavone reductase
MTIDRRDVLRAALSLSVLSACGAGKPAPQSPPPNKKLRILILGGSGFLGPKTIDAAIARGHSVTTFNRGRREKIQPLSQPIERLYGNRDPDKTAEDDKPSPKGLEQLVGKQWDIVIDNSGYFPRHVDASAQLLAKAAQRYIYISSISAYAEMPASGGDETTKLAVLADPTTEDMGKQFENYGGLKAACERAAQRVFGDRCVVVRPGYIVGPGDPTDRFTYWPARIAKGGDVLAPGSADDPLQWIDVRDLAAWLVTLAETGTTGTFNALGPAGRPARWGDVLDTCVRASKSNAKLVWVPQSFLASHGAGGEDLFPIWAPPTGETAGAHRWSNARAVAAGLTFHSIDDTVRAILDWFPHELERRIETTKKLIADAQAKGEPPPKMADPTQLRAGPTAEQEHQLLAQFAP